MACTCSFLCPSFFSKKRTKDAGTHARTSQNMRCWDCRQADRAEAEASIMRKASMVASRGLDWEGARPAGRTMSQGASTSQERVCSRTRAPESTGLAEAASEEVVPKKAASQGREVRVFWWWPAAKKKTLHKRLELVYKTIRYEKAVIEQQEGNLRRKEGISALARTDTDGLERALY